MDAGLTALIVPLSVYGRVVYCGCCVAALRCEGRNLPYYDFRAVRSLIAVDRSLGMLRETKGKWDGISRALQHASGQHSLISQPQLTLLHYDLDQLSSTPAAAAPPQSPLSSSFSALSAPRASAPAAAASVSCYPPFSAPCSVRSSPMDGGTAAAAASPHLPFASGSFDCVVDTFGLCSYGSELAALHEMGRLVRPHSGCILLLQHGRRHEQRAVTAWLDAAVNGYLARHRARHVSRWGCVWDRDLQSAVQHMVDQHGWRVVDTQRFHLGTGLLLVAQVGEPRHSL